MRIREQKEGRGSRLVGAVMVAMGLCMAGRVNALILYGSGSTNHNTTAPTGPFAGSGWQFQGRWRSFLGTPVGPSHFITAKHVGGSTRDVFSWNGVNYSVTGFENHPTADLTLWRIAGRFPSYAPLYTAPTELGRGLVVFGRGQVRGAEVHVANASPSSLRGWRWGGSPGVMRWGVNRVDWVSRMGGADYLWASFDRSSGPNEATFATGDSGGAVFIQDGATWKLAGINYAVQADFATSPTGASFLASIFDMGGLFSGATVGQRLFMADRPADLNAFWLATRISSYAAWIRSNAGLP